MLDDFEILRSRSFKGILPENVLRHGVEELNFQAKLFTVRSYSGCNNQVGFVCERRPFWILRNLLELRAGRRRFNFNGRNAGQLRRQCIEGAIDDNAVPPFQRSQACGDDLLRGPPTAKRRRLSGDFEKGRLGRSRTKSEYAQATSAVLFCCPHCCTTGCF